MSQPNPVTCTQLTSSFDQLVFRIYRQVKNSASQERRRTVIMRQPTERVDDWDCLLEQLGAEDSVRVMPLEEGVVQLNWTNQHC